jgi:hypothetical protein
LYQLTADLQGVAWLTRQAVVDRSGLEGVLERRLYLNQCLTRYIAQMPSLNLFDCVVFALLDWSRERVSLEECYGK